MHDFRKVHGVGVARLQVAMLVMCMLAVPVALALPENPPTFVLKWGGLGTGNGQFASPRGVAVGNDGSVYIADTENARVQRFTSNGTYISQWGTSTGPEDPGAFDIAADAAGNLFTVGGNVVQKFDPSGTLIHSWPIVFATGAIAVDRLRGFVYLTVVNVVLKYSTSGDSLTRWTAGPGGTFGELNDGIAVGPSGDVYVKGGLVRVFSSDGTLIRQWPAQGGGIGVDASERVYVTFGNGITDGIRKYTSTGTLLSEWGSSGVGDGQFLAPRGIGFSSDTTIYVCDKGNHRIQKFAYVPTPVTRASWGQIKARYRR